MAEITKEELKEVRSKAIHLEPAVRIGKNGLTEHVLAEISKHLRKKQIVKIKMLAAFMEGHEKSYKKQVAQEIANKTDSHLVDLTGFVIVLYRPRK